MERPLPWPGHWRASDRLARTTPFSYSCSACGRCCRHKGIRVSPYEIARLARYLGLSTTEVIAAHIDHGELKRRDDGTCVFLTDAGCGVHAERPYVCRLYPLMRHRERDGTETFHHDLPHPETAGRYGTDGAVADWLEAQGIPPYLKAVDDYHLLFRRILARIAALEGTEGVAGWPEDPTEYSMAWMDMDAALGPPEPGADIEARAQAHIRWIEAQVPPAPDARPSDEASEP